MTAFIFLGPSLPLAEAQRIFASAVYLPPVAMGDLYTLVASRARPGDRVGIVDGVFEQVPAVWHKEILFALSRGIYVYGAASMGALRAAELHPFGMRGVGRIFEAFRDEQLVSDDEVVVAHAQGDRGFRALSDALASIRFGLRDMAAEGLVTPALARELTGAVETLHYSQRSWSAVLDAARARGAPAAVTDAIRARAREADAKAKDAAALIALLRGEEASGGPPHQPDFTFQNTSFWVSLTQSMAMRVEAARSGDPGADDGTDAAVAAFARAGDPCRDALLEGALLDRLAVDVARTFEPERGDLQEAQRRIARRHGLRDGEALAGWRRGQQLGEAEWRRLLVAEARRHWLIRQFADRLDPFILARLKAEGRYGEVRERLERARNAIAASAVAKPALADFGLSPEALQAWYEARFGPMRPDPTGHARQLGFATLRDFVDSLLACYLAEEDLPSAQPAAAAGGGGA